VGEEAPSDRGFWSSARRPAAGGWTQAKAIPSQQEGKAPCSGAPARVHGGARPRRGPHRAKANFEAHGKSCPELIRIRTSYVRQKVIDQQKRWRESRQPSSCSATQLVSQGGGRQGPLRPGDDPGRSEAKSRTKARGPDNPRSRPPKQTGSRWPRAGGARAGKSPPHAPVTATSSPPCSGPGRRDSAAPINTGFSGTGHRRAGPANQQLFIVR